MKKTSTITLATVLALNSLTATAMATSNQDISKILAQADQSNEVKVQTMRLALLRENLKALSANYASIETELTGMQSKIHNGAKLTGNYLAISGAVLGIAALILAPKTDFAAISASEKATAAAAAIMGFIAAANGVALNVANVTQKMTDLDYDKTSQYIAANHSLIRIIETTKQAGPEEIAKIQKMKELLNQAKVDIDNQNIQASKGALLKYASYLVDAVPFLLVSKTFADKNGSVAPALLGIGSTLATGYISKAMMMYSQLNEVQQEQVLLKIREAKLNADNLILQIDRAK